MITYFMKNKDPKPSIGIIGLWHLGLVYAVSLAKLGYKIIGSDLDSKTVTNLKIGKPPLFEPKLAEELKKHLNKNLFFSAKPEEAIKNMDFIFICMDIPINKKGQSDQSLLYRLFDLVLNYCSPKTNVILSSQVAVGTSRQFLSRLKLRSPTTDLIYFPENLRLGRGIDTFLHPDRIVLGSGSGLISKRLINFFQKFNCPIIKMSLESAEMVKHALNSYLALNISFSSEIGDLCEITNANFTDVITALKTDKRISPYSPINPGLGFSGGTLERDLQSLITLSNKYDYDPLLLKAVLKVNQNRLNTLMNKINKIFPNLEKKKIGLLGLTYKPGTNTLRSSQSLKLAQLLFEKKVYIKAFDPSIRQAIKTHPYIDIATSADTFFKDLDLAILMTDWPEFRQINLKKISSLMNKKIIFDTKNFLDGIKYSSSGFTYYKMGDRL